MQASSLWLTVVAIIVPIHGLWTWRVAPARAEADSHHCDPLLQVSEENPLAYRARGDRCEGLYVQQVAATPLLVAEFGVRRPQAKNPPRFKPGALVEVRWSAVSQPVQLRSVSLKPRTYYRMDTRRPGTATRFSWPTHILAAAGLATDEVGYVLWTEQTVGSRSQALYLPIQLATQVSGNPPQTYWLRLVPGEELSHVTFEVTRLNAAGEPQEVVRLPKEPVAGYYPAGRPFALELNAPTKPGLYRVEVGALLREGGAASADFIFLQPSRPPAPVAFEAKP